MSEHEGAPVWGGEVVRNLRGATEALAESNRAAQIRAHAQEEMTRAAKRYNAMEDHWDGEPMAFRGIGSLGYDDRDDEMIFCRRCADGATHRVSTFTEAIDFIFGL
jgi:hypothetical protein